MDLDFLFSAAVGAAITEAVFEKSERVNVFCTRCGKQARMGDSFCCYCGAKVQGSMKGRGNMYGEAMNCYRQGKYREAISVLEKRIESGDSNPMIYLALWYSWAKFAASQRGNKNIFLNATDRVVEYSEVILQLDRRGISIPADMLEEVKKITIACQSYRDVLTGKVQVYSEKAKEYDQKADLAVKAGDFKQALQLETKAIEAETSNDLLAAWHGKRAVIRRVLRDYSGALADCKVALECERLPEEFRKTALDVRNSVKIDRYIDKYKLAVEAKDTKKAIQYVTKAIELETDDASIAFDLALRASARGDLGDYAGALDDCKTALKCKGTDARVRKAIIDIQRSAQDALKSTKGKGSISSKASTKKTSK